MAISSVDNSHASLDSGGSLSQIAPLEAVLFDIDGTLCDTDPLHYSAFREMLKEIGFNGGVPITEEFFIANIAGKHNEDIASVLFPNDHERGLKFTDDKEAVFRRIVKEKIEPVKGLHKFTKWIEDRGLKRAAVTNAPRENAELMISLLGLSDFFHALILGSDCERVKPFPDPYLKALEVLKVSKEHTCVFEDSVSGIKAGVAAGMPTIGLTTRNPAELLMQAKPAFLIKDYEDPKLWTALDELDKMGFYGEGISQIENKDELSWKYYEKGLDWQSSRDGTELSLRVIDCALLIQTQG
ncbi:UNVERIFIED_CONTAM: Haloacid dehalogenase-like hydrolase domain-containing protein Sgpp [Sesamum indicum]